MDKIAVLEPEMSTSPTKNITTVIREFGKRLLSFIRQRVKTDADAEDILQDVWYQLTATIDSGPIEQVGSWLYTVAGNKIIDRYRKKKPESLDSLFGEGEDGEPGFQDILFDNSKNPETEMLRNLFWKTLQEALNELPEEQRMVFVQNELEGVSFKALAEQTGELVPTLISRKRYAVLHLRERLQTLYNELIQH